MTTIHPIRKPQVKKEKKKKEIRKKKKSFFKNSSHIYINNIKYNPHFPRTINITFLYIT